MVWIKKMNLRTAVLLAGLTLISWVSAAQPAGTFSATGNMLTARASQTATLCPNGKVLIAGGISQPLAAQGLSSAELYDPTAGTFSATGSMSVPRISHTATLLPDGRVLITGGFAGFANQAIAGVTATAELYDPGTGTFMPTGECRFPASRTPRHCSLTAKSSSGADKRRPQQPRSFTTR
jgi:Galactose oxidase, central domain